MHSPDNSERRYHHHRDAVHRIEYVLYELLNIMDHKEEENRDADDQYHIIERTLCLLYDVQGSYRDAHDNDDDHAKQITTKDMKWKECSYLFLYSGY